MDLLTAIGPVDSRKIRRDYLRKNDAYLLRSLKDCSTVMPIFARYRQITTAEVLGWYKEHIEMFDKCRDNVLAWMEFNTDWRSRCTEDNINLYRRPIPEVPFVYEANLVFNNPMVAIELGLEEVYAHLVHEMGIDICATDCIGYTSDFPPWVNTDKYLFNQSIVAMYRGNEMILKTLFSSEPYRTNRPSDGKRLLSQYEIIEYCYEQNEIPVKTFKAIISNPSMDLKRMPEHSVCLTRFIDELNNSTVNTIDFSYGFITHRVGIICALIDAGLHPRLSKDESNVSLLSRVRALTCSFKSSERSMWQQILEKMEEQDNRG